MNAGRVLRYARRQAGLTQRALAAKTGVPQPQIARIESGAVSPRLDTLERLMAGIGVALEVSPRIGDGVDRSLIRASLARDPETRIRAAEAAARNLATFLGETRHGSSR